MMIVSEDFLKFKQLDTAVRKGQTRIVQTLLEKGAPVNGCVSHSMLKKPLHSSVQSGNSDIVKKLLQYGASVNSKYAGDTPLTLAAKFGRFEIMDLLLSVDNLRNCNSAEKITHFQIACMRNQTSVVKKLFQSKKELDDAVDIHSNYWPGFTALHYAVLNQNVEIVKFLLSVGANITVKDARSFTPLHLAHILRNEEIIDMILLNHKNVLKNPVDSNGTSHFHIACSRNNTKIVQHFLKMRINLEDSISKNSPFWKHKTAIDFAIHYECVDVVKLLLQNGARVRFPGDRRFDRIMNAYSTGNSHIIDLITVNKNLCKKTEQNENSANLGQFARNDDDEIDEVSMYQTPDASIASTCTLLHYAIEQRNHDLSMYLLNVGADYTIQDINGKSALHLAFEYKMLDLVDSMLNIFRDVDVNPTNDEGLSHVHIASARDNSDFVENFLVNFNADVDIAVNFNSSYCPGFTPLHFAAKFGNEKTASILLQHGANYSLKNASDQTPFDIALKEVLQQGGHTLFQSGFNGVLKGILKHHFQVKGKHNFFNFDSHGITLLHVANFKSEYFRIDLELLREYLKIHPDDINRSIDEMDTIWDGYTPLHLNIEHGKKELVKLLIDAGGDLLKQASDGDTPLHLVTESSNLPEILINPEDSRYLELNHIGTSGYSIFHCACKQGDLELIKHFLRQGVDVNQPTQSNGFGYKNAFPLHMVVDSVYKDAVTVLKLLLEHGADPNLRDCRYETPLHYITETPNTEMIDLLVTHGADVDARNAFDETPLITACADPHLCPETLNRHILTFFNNGADINAVDERGMSALGALNDVSSDHSMREQDEFENFKIAVKTMLTHYIKVKTVGFHVSDDLTDEFYNLLYHSMEDIDFDEISVIDECDNELELMKQIQIDRCTTLYDILLSSQSKLGVLSRNQVFQNIIESDDFDRKYPLYGFMLKLRMKEGKIRCELINESQETVKYLSGVRQLPRDCVEDVLKYLDNEDLKNVILINKVSPRGSVRAS
ncbi:hypothetical protein QAD02_009695 [Eretmocerus hayati]|uniref:Uncharacterized protein n=1 Tax=Eretmocerus hayati TaxID=131215 RepID=A0ACC2NAE6_9HYME|nr:hypothetical protein QAD02_009695 [Eretmocerus hayati]